MENVENTDERLDASVERNAGQLIDTTRELLRIDTVSAAPAGPSSPFGDGLRRAMGFYLGLGREMGFTTCDVDGYAGHVEYGAGDEIVGVLSHLDVVLPGAGWSVPPFGAVERNGALYARGAMDDKGPAMATLWALRAVREAGRPLRRRVRVIVGTDEELWWRCMAHYFTREPRPTLGFTPDGVFPLVNVEKGVLTCTLHAWPEDVPHDESAARIVSLHGGERPNVVPAHAECLLALPSGRADDAVARVRAYAATRGGRVGAAAEDRDHVHVWAAGAGAHASRPSRGHNAIGELLLALDGLNLAGGRAGILVRALAHRVGTAYDGAGLGVALHDELSGSLTINLGLISGDADGAQATFDVRYPVSYTAAEIEARVRGAVAGSGVSLSPIREGDQAPHAVPADGELVRTLRAVYRATVGGDDTPRSMGGVTYGRAAGNMVAFGPRLPGRPELAHMPDEHIRLDDLVLLARIYARAIYALAG